MCVAILIKRILNISDRAYVDLSFNSVDIVKCFGTVIFLAIQSPVHYTKGSTCPSPNS